MPWATSANDGRDHIVVDDEFDAAIIARRGRCVAVCGHEVRMCALTRPFGPECYRCHEAPARVPPRRIPPWRWWRRWWVLR